MNRPIGKFKATREVVIGNYPESLKVMANFVVLDVRWDWNGSAEYTALSPLFEEIPEECVPLEYQIIISKGDDGEISVKAEKQ